MRKLEIGDTVGYSKNFLQLAGILTGPIPFARGKVVRFIVLSSRSRLAVVKWDNDEVPTRVLEANLAKVGSREWDD